MINDLDRWFDEMADPYKTDSQIRELLNAAHKYLGGYYTLLKKYSDITKCPACGASPVSDSITDEGLTMCSECGCEIPTEVWSNRLWWKE